MLAKAYSLSHFSQIEITGPAVRKFLQGQFTCDIEQISASQSRLAAHCNPQGRMQSLGRIYEYSQKLYYCIPTCIADSSLQNLKPYAQFSKTSFNTSSLKSIGIIGNMDEIKKSYPLPEQEDGCCEQGNLLIIRLRGEPKRYMVIGPEHDLQKFCQSINLTTVTEITAWLEAEIRAGQAFLSQETQGKFLPHDINLPQNDGVSFNKGCYIGQEIIARMHYLGKIKKQLCLVEIQTKYEPKAGQTILDENKKPQAELVCFAPAGLSSYVGLAVFNQTPNELTYQLDQNAQVKLLQSFSS
jgi:folate-binding protein YgfZ